MASLNEDRRRGGRSASWNRSVRIARRTGGLVMWSSLAVMVVVLVKSTVARVAAEDPADYSVRAIESCPKLGHFLEWAPQPNQVDTEGACLLCVCKDLTSALCWRRDPRRCKHLSPTHVRRSKRIRRSSLLGSLLRPTIMDRNQKKKYPGKTGTCKPFQGSYSEGCPPDDWCVGCTVCDCNAEGRWDCHLLSFCGDKKPNQKQGRKISAKDKIKPEYMKEFMKAAKRQTTKPKPKVIKRKAPTITTKKRAYKPTVKPKPKPKPKRSIKQPSDIPDRSYGYNDSALAQEVVKRVMAAIQEMTHRKYGIRPEMRRWLAATTIKPSLKFKKITKKPTPPKKPSPKPKQKPLPKSQPVPRPQEKKSTGKVPSKPANKPTIKIVSKPPKTTTTKQINKVTNKPIAKKAVEKVTTQASSTTKRKRPRQKMLEEELQKIIAKAASKIHMQNVRSKRELAENYFDEVNETVPLLTMSTIVATNTTRQKYSSTTAVYETKDYNLPSGNGQDQYYEFSALDDKNINGHLISKERYYMYATATASENVTPEVTVNDEATRNLVKTNLSKNGNASGTSVLLLPKTYEKTHIPDPLTPTTENNSYNTSSSNLVNVSAFISETGVRLSDGPQTTKKNSHTSTESNLKQNLSVVIPENIESKTTVLLNNIDNVTIRISKGLEPNQSQEKYANDYGYNGMYHTKTLDKASTNNPYENLMQIRTPSTIPTDLYSLPRSNEKGNVPFPYFSKTTEKYLHDTTRSNFVNLSMSVPKNMKYTVTEMKSNLSKSTLDTSTERRDVSNEDYDVGVKVIDKRFDIVSGLNITSNDSNDIQVFINKPQKLVKPSHKSFDTFAILYNKTEKENCSKNNMPVVLKQNIENTTSPSEFSNLFSDLGFELMVTSKVHTKGPERNSILQNYFRRLLRYIFSKTKKERRNLRKNLLEKQNFHKLEIINAVCKNFGPCNMTSTKKLLLKPLLKELSTETKKIFKTIKIIKGLLHLVDMPQAKYEIKGTDKLKLDMTKLDLIVKGAYEKQAAGPLTETENTQINFIKNNTDVFMHSVGKFAATLNKLIEILTSDTTRTSRRRHIRADVDSEKAKVQTVFKRIKAVLSEHNIAEETLIDALSHNITKKDRTDILHLIYRNSDIMDNYKYRLLEILGKLKGVLGRIETIKAERRYNAMLKARKTDEERKKAEKKKLEEAEKKKQQLEKKRKEYEGIGIWNMGRPDRRRKRQLEDEGIYEYLLMIMEFLLKQPALTRTTAPVNDGIDLLVRAIQDAPDIEPIWRTQPVVYQSPKRTKSVKPVIQQKYAAVPIKRKNIQLHNFNVIKPTTEKLHYLDDIHNMKNIAITKKPYKQYEREKMTANIEDVADDDDDDYDHRYERHLNSTKLERTNEKLVQFTDEDPNTSRLEKVMEKMVYKRVSIGDKDDNNNFDAGYFNGQHVDDIREDRGKNIESESTEDTTTTKSIEPPRESTISPPIPIDCNSELHCSKVKSSHKLRQQYQHPKPKVGMHQHPKPKLTWVADVSEENNAIVEHRPDKTSTSSTSARTPTPTPARTTTEKATTTDIPFAPTRTEARKKKIKRNTTSPELILHRKQMDLLHSLDYIASDRESVSNQETIEEY